MPETYPGITFNSNGICNFCEEKKHHNGKKINETDNFESEEELIASLQKYKGIGKYDLLISASGGVDSSAVIIEIVEKFGLNPLVWHNDHGYEFDIATNNVRNLCKALNLDLIILQHDYKFMKKLWKFTVESEIYGANCCFMCANILYWNALKLADLYGIKIIINGYSKGQVGFNADYNREILFNMIQKMMETEDSELYETFLEKYEIMQKHKGYLNINDLTNPVEMDKILVIPFYLFKFYKTDKQKLRKKCESKFRWEQIPTGYPSQTTNCKINWLTTYVDLLKVGYSIYTDEYAGLVRSGEITREYALKVLEFNPPEGLLERLINDIGVDKSKIKRMY